MGDKQISIVDLFGTIGIVLIAFALRIHLLGDSNIWYDEGLAVWAARQSLLDIARWTSVDVHPPLYFWFLHGWRALVGESAFAARWLSVAAGVLTIAATYTLGRVLFKRAPISAWRWIPLAGAFILAVMRFHVWWSQEARMYIFGGLWVVLSLYFTVKLRERITTKRVVAYLVVTSAALWTLYLLAFLLVVEGLYWLATLPRSREWLRSVAAWAALQTAVLASFAPWLGYALPRMQQWSVQENFDGGQFARLYAVLLAVGVSTNVEQVVGVTVVVMVGVIVGLLVAWRQAPQRGGIFVLLLALIVPPLVVYIATTIPRSFGYSPKPEARYLLPYAPAFALLGGVAVVALLTLARRWGSVFRRYTLAVPLVAGIGISAFLGVAWVNTLQAYYADRVDIDDYISITDTIRAYWRDGDSVLLQSDQPWPDFVYHWDKSWDGVTYTQDVDEGSSLNEVYQAWQSNDAIWLVLNEDAQRIDPQHSVETWLDGQALARQEWRFGTKRLVFYARTQPRADVVLALAPLPTGQAHPQWEQPLHRVMPGTLAHFFYTFEVAEGATPVTLLVGDAVNPIATATIQTTRTGFRRHQFDLLFPSDAPSGHYELTVQYKGVSQIVGTIEILPAPPRTTESVELPDTATGTTTTFGDAVTLVGYEVNTATLQVGDPLTITLYWRAAQPIALPYKVFVHVAAQDEEIWGQADGEPVNGTRPTTTWATGEIVADTYTLILDPATPIGAYTVWVGLYDAATGTRLSPVLDDVGNAQAADRARLMDLSVGN